jgi:hypothetical protein
MSFAREFCFYRSTALSYTLEPMQSTPTDSYSTAASGVALPPDVAPATESTAKEVTSPSDSTNLIFEGQYAGQMDMAADVETVGQYLNSHHGWFARCASPMQVEPLSDNGYALVVGHFSVLGYEVEPKVGLYLSPLDHLVYRIDTIPVPNYTPPGYDVDFKACLELKDGQRQADFPHPITRIDWELSLAVEIHAPRFVRALPYSLVKSSGDRLLNQVVRQVSKRLTRKVQEDFHSMADLPLPPSYHRHHFWSHWGKS